MPMTRWNAKGVSSQHIGPVSQDFYAAFGLGEDDLHIASGDLSGVALAAIQGLYAEVKARDATIAELREELAALRNAVATAPRGATIAACSLQSSTAPMRHQAALAQSSSRLIHSSVSASPASRCAFRSPRARPATNGAALAVLGSARTTWYSPPPRRRRRRRSAGSLPRRR